MNNGENTFSNDENQKKEQRLVDIPVSDQNSSLNLMVSFLTLANKRGTFTLEESSKIWECIKIFQKPN
jgi:hypothetical protein